MQTHIINLFIMVLSVMLLSIKQAVEGILRFNKKRKEYTQIPSEIDTWRKIAGVFY